MVIVWNVFLFGVNYNTTVIILSLNCGGRFILQHLHHSFQHIATTFRTTEKISSGFVRELSAASKYLCSC